MMISKVGHTVLTRLMESQIEHKLTSSVGGRFSKGAMASTRLDARHFSFSLYTTGAFQAATLNDAGAQRECVFVGESVCGFFKRNYLGLQQVLPLTQSPLDYATRNCGDLNSWHWNPGLVSSVDLGLLALRYPSPNFIHMGVGPACSVFALPLPV